jgi:hypothetical protein
VGALLSWFSNFSAFAEGTNTALPAKIVRQYALTSANDFPQRDPMDWRLLGSDDGGETWSVLDERKGVLFSERHQRQLFKITNQTAFNLYRLEIERIRKPAEANSVQLAELEPLGETEADLDPVPIFADRITAQGENPDLEKPVNLFDGQIDTKWLDFAGQHPNTRASWVQWQYTDHTDLVISNIAHLTELRSNAAKHYAVRIVGWITGSMERSNQWCLMDATGDIELQTSSSQLSLSPGQRVCVEGISGAIGQRAEFGEVRVIREGASASPVPVQVIPGEPLPTQEEMKWVEVSGTIRF